MTCIVAVALDGKVWMGGDSLALSGCDVAERQGKVFIWGNLIIGISGSVRVSQLVEYGLPTHESIGSQDREEPDLVYLVNKFIPAIRDILKQGGYTKIESGVESIQDIILIGMNGNIYKMYSDFAVCKPDGKFAAIGSGEAFALGALAVEQITSGNVEEKIWKALEVSAKFNVGIGPPYYVKSR